MVKIVGWLFLPCGFARISFIILFEVSRGTENFASAARPVQSNRNSSVLMVSDKEWMLERHDADHHTILG